MGQPALQIVLLYLRRREKLKGQKRKLKRAISLPFHSIHLVETAPHCLHAWSIQSVPYFSLFRFSFSPGLFPTNKLTEISLPPLNL